MQPYIWSFQWVLKDRITWPPCRRCLMLTRLIFRFCRPTAASGIPYLEVLSSDCIALTEWRLCLGNKFAVSNWMASALPCPARGGRSAAIWCTLSVCILHTVRWRMTSSPSFQDLDATIYHRCNRPFLDLCTVMAISQLMLVAHEGAVRANALISRSGSQYK